MGTSDRAKPTKSIRGSLFGCLVIGLSLVSLRSTANAIELAGIDHFAINVHDVRASAEWYQHILGFKVLHKWDNAWMVGRGNIKIGLFIEPKATPIPDVNSQKVIRKIAFLVDGDKFAASIAELKNKGIDVSATEDTGIAYSVFFHDLDGYTLELTTFHGDGPPPGLGKK